MPGTSSRARHGAALLLLPLAAACAAATPPPAPAAAAAGLPTPTGDGAIFFHPDGTSAGHWDATRSLYYGPDGSLHWDRLAALTTYRGHLADQLGATSNAGAVIHATGTRAHAASFGLDPAGREYVSADGSTRTLMETAVAAGLGTALVQTGSVIEPGTAAFVAAVPRRQDYEEIARQVLESGVEILLGGGEEWFLPRGVRGRFGEGARSDGRNLIERARELGYTVVYTRAELRALPPTARRVLGVFARGHTFHDRTEEELRQAGLPHYLPGAPTVAEMIDFALARLGTSPRGFLLVAEEEGSDNFCNVGNAAGCLEALRRADDAFGVMRAFIERRPNTLLLTTSDSNAGGIQVVNVAADATLTPRTAPNGAPLDGSGGTGTAPFRSAPDAQGRSFPFAIGWTSYDDAGSGVLARAHGLRATELLPATGIQNIDVYRILYETLFGRRLP